MIKERATRIKKMPSEIVDMRLLIDSPRVNILFQENPELAKQLEGMIDMHARYSLLVWDEAIKKHGLESLFYIQHEEKGKISGIELKSRVIADMYEEMIPEFGPYLADMPEKMGSLFGHFENSISAEGLEPFFDIVSNVVAQEFGRRVDASLFNSPLFKKLRKKDKSYKAQHLGFEIGQAMIEAGQGRLNKSMDDVLPDQPWNFRVIFGSNYLLAMEKNGVPPNEFARSRINTTDPVKIKKR